MTFIDVTALFLYKNCCKTYRCGIAVLNFHFKFAPEKGVLAHLVERNTGSVEVSGSSPLCSTSTALL